MKQKIVMKVQMNCEKCRRKAMKIAVKAEGVVQVEIQGEEKDQLVVIGDEVDSVNLTRSLRKKLQYATILSVQEEKEKKEEKKEQEKEEPIPMQYAALGYYNNPIHEVLAYEPNPSICSIL